MWQARSSTEPCDQSAGGAVGSNAGLLNEPYPPLSQLGIIGDRRTAAGITADGTVRWLCLPNYDGTPVFGCLVDAVRGGRWALGPTNANAGRQSYHGETNVLVTNWQMSRGDIELTDAMICPESARPAIGEGKRTLLRRLRCLRGSVECTMQLMPRDDFAKSAVSSPVPGGLELRVGGLALGLWTSHPFEWASAAFTARFTLAEGEEFWAVLGLGEDPKSLGHRRGQGCISSNIIFLGRAQGTIRLRGISAGSGHPLGFRYRAAFFCTDRRDRCRPHQFASRADRGRSQL